MPRSSNRPSAVVVLPPGVSARGSPPAERRWLAKGRSRTCAAGGEALPGVLEVLGRPAVGDGMAALRKWGQTGRRPDGWLCAADPVYLEARLDHLCLFALRDVADEEFASLIGSVQARLAPHRELEFSCVGACGYLERPAPMATASVSAAAAHGEPPDRFLPGGREAADHDRLQSELQMCLHELAQNRQREAEGRPPVNALWFWGGGRAPARRDDAGLLPALFSDDPLTRGYWLAAGGQQAAWPGSVAACAGAARGAFVAVVPPTSDTAGDLALLRKLLARGDVGRLTLLFGDGLRVDLDRGDRLRFWRRARRLPGEGGAR